MLLYQMYMNCFIKLFISAPSIHRTSESNRTFWSTRFYNINHRTGNEGPEMVERIRISFFNIGARGRGVSRTHPGRFTAGNETRYPSYRRLGGPQSRSGWLRKISPFPVIDPRTTQTVAGRYTDLAFPANLRCFTVQNPNMHIRCEIYS